MIKRTLSTLVLLSGAILLLWQFGAMAGVALLLFLAAASQHELYRMLEACGFRPLRKTGIILGLAYLLAAYLMPRFLPTAGAYQLGFDGLGLALVVIAAGGLLFSPPKARIGTIASTALGFLYVPFLLHFFIRIVDLIPGDETTGLLLAFWVVLVVKSADIGAYLTGSLIGEHKLAPSISPGKTWEGALGGILVCAGVAAGYALLFRDYFPMGLGPAAAALAAVFIGAVSIVSDLTESAFKRAANMKDSGNSIPGIGGAFDLTDSLLLAVPVAYGLLLLVV